MLLFVLHEAYFSSMLELTSALSCLFAWACDLVYYATKSFVYFASLETVPKYMHFFVFVRQTGKLQRRKPSSSSSTFQRE